MVSLMFSNIIAFKTSKINKISIKKASLYILPKVWMTVRNRKKICSTKKKIEVLKKVFKCFIQIA